jgi:hypothetical protein
VGTRRHSDRRREESSHSIAGWKLHPADLSLVVGVEASIREDLMNRLIVLR